MHQMQHVILVIYTLDVILHLALTNLITHRDATQDIGIAVINSSV